MSTINQIQLPNGSTYDFEDTAAREAVSNKADKTLATASTNGLMSTADKSKLDGIGAGSNVKSVNGKTGAVTLSKADVGLGNVANLDQSKAIKSITRSGTTFTATALDGTTTTFTQQAAGYAGEAEYRLMIDPDTGCMALAHYNKEA